MPTAPLAVLAAAAGGSAPASPAVVLEEAGAGLAPASPGVALAVATNGTLAAWSLTVTGTADEAGTVALSGQFDDGFDIVAFAPDIVLADGDTSAEVAAKIAAGIIAAITVLGSGYIDWFTIESIGADVILTRLEGGGTLTGTYAGGYGTSAADFTQLTEYVAPGYAEVPAAVLAAPGDGSTPGAPSVVLAVAGAGSAPSAPSVVVAVAGAGSAPSAPGAVLVTASAAAAPVPPAGILGMPEYGLYNSNNAPLRDTDGTILETAEVA